MLCCVSVCEMCDPDFAASQEETEGQAAVAAAAAAAAPATAACQKPDGHLFYFLGGRSGGTIAAHASDMTLGWKDPRRSDREGGRGQ